MNDFEMVLDDIRVKLHEEMKTKSTSEIVLETNDHAQKIAVQYGFKIVKADTSRGNGAGFKKNNTRDL